MVERGEQPRLAQQFAEVEALPVRDLDGDALVDPCVFREIDRAEPAAAERLDDAVLAERLAAKHHSRKYSSVPRFRRRIRAPELSRGEVLQSRCVTAAFHVPSSRRTRGRRPAGRRSASPRRTSCGCGPGADVSRLRRRAAANGPRAWRRWAKRAVTIALGDPVTPAAEPPVRVTLAHGARQGRSDGRRRFATRRRLA